MRREAQTAGRVGGNTRRGSAIFCKCKVYNVICRFVFEMADAFEHLVNTLTVSHTRCAHATLWTHDADRLSTAHRTHTQHRRLDPITPGHTGLTSRDNTTPRRHNSSHTAPHTAREDAAPSELLQSPRALPAPHLCGRPPHRADRPPLTPTYRLDTKTQHNKKKCKTRLSKITLSLRHSPSRWNRAPPP